MHGEFLPESTLRDIVDGIVRLVELGGAVVILAGAAWTFARFVAFGVRWGRHPRAGRQDPNREFNQLRLTLGRFLTLGLEFQLAGDILRTAIAPTFAEIGQLAAIAAIRTALNYFLGKEIERERDEVERSAGSKP